MGIIIPLYPRPINYTEKKTGKKAKTKTKLDNFPFQAQTKTFQFDKKAFDTTVWQKNENILQYSRLTNCW